MLWQPIHVEAKAQTNEPVEPKIEYRTETGNVAFNTTGVPDVKSYEAQIQTLLVQPRKRTTTVAKNSRPVVVSKYKTNFRYLQCVEYAQQFLGFSLGSDWGNGAKNLSLNSDGEIHDVVIFKSEHAAVEIARVGSDLTITEANYDWLGHIRTRHIDVNDPSILGFHKF